MSVMERCPYYRVGVYMNIALFRPSEMSVIERCLYYRLYIRRCLTVLVCGSMG